MSLAYILTGGNLGDREAIQKTALEKIGRKAGRVTACSLLYSTAPWGFHHEKDFLNRVIALETELSPATLLQALLEIEREMGRERKAVKGYSGRTLDLDILFYGDLIVDQPGLTIPHPRMPERRFALLPLCELVPEMKDPRSGKTVRQLLEECPDEGDAQPFQDCATITSP